VRRAALLAFAVFLAATGNAAAHKLKLFAAAAGDTVSGYGFFVGGGRPAGAALVARDAGGNTVWRGTTGDDGSFSFTVAAPAGLTLSIDAGDGHAAEATIAGGGSAPVPPSSAAAPAGDDAALAALVAAEVDKAVARQIRPLLEASAAAEARLRLNDILGGLGWIAGLVGVGLVVARRRKP
jgi:nickel transport protein